SPVRILRAFLLHLWIDAASHPEQVGVTVIVEIQDGCAPAYITGLDAQAGSNGDIFEAPLAAIGIQGWGVFVEVRLQNAEGAVEIEVPDAQSHACLFLAVLVQRDSNLDATLAERSVLVVLEEQAGCGIASDVDFRPSIVVEIRRYRGESIRAGGFRDPRGNADIGKGAVAVVPVQHLSFGLQAARAAVHGDALEIADIVLAGGRDDLGIEL